MSNQSSVPADDTDHANQPYSAATTLNWETLADRPPECVNTYTTAKRGTRVRRMRHKLTPLVLATDASRGNAGVVILILRILLYLSSVGLYIANDTYDESVVPKRPAATVFNETTSSPAANLQANALLHSSSWSNAAAFQTVDSPAESFLASMVQGVASGSLTQGDQSFSKSRRPVALLAVQLFIAVLTLVDSSLRIIARTGPLFTRADIYDMINLGLAIPLFVAISPAYRDVHTPTYIHCWHARYAFRHLLHVRIEAVARLQGSSREAMFGAHDVGRMVVTIVCLLFTAMCGFEQIEREYGEDCERRTLFDSLYFVIVTVTTVGYGDITPCTELSQLWVLAMIVTGFILLPREIARVTQAYTRAKISGGAYTASRPGQHIVLITGLLDVSALRDFLQELHSTKLAQRSFVVVLTPEPPSDEVRTLLQQPRWVYRTKVLTGSALDMNDLKRAACQQAAAVFILPDPRSNDLASADSETVLRSWAVNDFQPKIRQYVFLHLPENRILLSQVNAVVVAGEELRFAFLAASCMHQGTATLMTQLIHTSSARTRLQQLEKRHNDIVNADKEKERQLAMGLDDHTRERVKRERVRLHLQAAELALNHAYAHCSGSELYEAIIKDSALLRDYSHKAFGLACFDALRYGVCLVAVLPHCTCADDRLIRRNEARIATSSRPSMASNGNVLIEVAGGGIVERRGGGSFARGSDAGSARSADEIPPEEGVHLVRERHHAAPRRVFNPYSGSTEHVNTASSAVKFCTRGNFECGTLLVNPGNSFVLHPHDTVYYIGQGNEAKLCVPVDKAQSQRSAQRQGPRTSSARLGKADTSKQGHGITYLHPLHKQLTECVADVRREMKRRRRRRARQAKDGVGSAASSWFTDDSDDDELVSANEPPSAASVDSPKGEVFETSFPTGHQVSAAEHLPASHNAGADNSTSAHVRPRSLSQVPRDAADSEREALTASAAYSRCHVEAGSRPGADSSTKNAHHHSMLTQALLDPEPGRNEKKLFKPSSSESQSGPGSPTRAKLSLSTVANLSVMPRRVRARRVHSHVEDDAGWGSRDDEQTSTASQQGAGDVPSASRRTKVASSQVPILFDTAPRKAQPPSGENVSDTSELGRSSRSSSRQLPATTSAPAVGSDGRNTALRGEMPARRSAFTSRKRRVSVLSLRPDVLYPRSPPLQCVMYADAAQRGIAIASSAKADSVQSVFSPGLRPGTPLSDRDTGLASRFRDDHASVESQRRYGGNTSTKLSHAKRRILDLTQLEQLHVDSLNDVIMLDMTSSNIVSEVQSGAFVLLAHLRKPQPLHVRFLQGKDDENDIDPTYLNPIVFVVSKVPGKAFQEFMQLFPKVYYYVGSLSNIRSSRLHTCIARSAAVAFIRMRYTAQESSESAMSDAHALVTISKVARLSSLQSPDGLDVDEPHVIAELSHQSNMRFMKFQALRASKKGLHAEGASGFLYRSAFASGSVFSASMLDTLLLQAHLKSPQVVSVISRMIGITTMCQGKVQAALPFGGLMTQIKVTRELFARLDQPDYNSLARLLIQDFNVVPIGLYLPALRRRFFRPLKERWLRQQLRTYGRSGQGSSNASAGDAARSHDDLDAPNDAEMAEVFDEHAPSSDQDDQDSDGDLADVFPRFDGGGPGYLSTLLSGFHRTAGGVAGATQDQESNQRVFAEENHVPALVLTNPPLYMPVSVADRVFVLLPQIELSDGLSFDRDLLSPPPSESAVAPAAVPRAADVAEGSDTASSAVAGAAVPAQPASTAESKGDLGTQQAPAASTGLKHAADFAPTCHLRGSSSSVSSPAPLASASNVASATSSKKRGSPLKTVRSASSVAKSGQPASATVPQQQQQRRRSVSFAEEDASTTRDAASRILNRPAPHRQRNEPLKSLLRTPVERDSSRPGPAQPLNDRASANGARVDSVADKPCVASSQSSSSIGRFSVREVKDSSDSESESD